MFRLWRLFRGRECERGRDFDRERDRARDPDLLVGRELLNVVA